jgi:hypothetical protein
MTSLTSALPSLGWLGHSFTYSFAPFIAFVSTGLWYEHNRQAAPSPPMMLVVHKEGQIIQTLTLTCDQLGRPAVGQWWGGCEGEERRGL